MGSLTVSNTIKATTHWTWKSNNHNKNDETQTQTHKPSFFTNKTPKPITHFTSASTIVFSVNPSKFPSPSHVTSEDDIRVDDDHQEIKHTTLLVESYHEHQRVKSLLSRLKKMGSCPLLVLKQDGDWPKDHFFSVIRFLQHSSMPHLILQVFDMWKNTERSRINAFNYEKIIGVLVEEGQMEDAVYAFSEMKIFGIDPSLQIYNALIRGYAMNGKFDEALSCLVQMKETSLFPESDTYDGLIEAYGKYKMYDEMGMCLKKMELDGCSPDRETYNLLIRELARGGLLPRMGKVYHSMRSKKIDLHSSTLIAMLEAYANFGILDKMERYLRRAWNLRAHVTEDLIRKLAGVYIKNYMFSRLYELGDDLSAQTGRTSLVWHLRLLSYACLLSRKGMDAIVREMEALNVPWNITNANIILLAYLKMKDFARLRMLLVKLSNCVEPDMVTLGVLFDAIDSGLGGGTRILARWGWMGLLHKNAETNTDSLVLAAFGKGQFLRNCEEAYTFLEHKANDKRKWTYSDLINLVANYKKKRPQLVY